MTVPTVVRDVSDYSYEHVLALECRGGGAIYRDGYVEWQDTPVLLATSMSQPVMAPPSADEARGGNSDEAPCGGEDTSAASAVRWARHET